MCKEDLDDHIMMNHVEKSLESTFFNPSVYNVDGCSREGEVREVWYPQLSFMTIVNPS